MTCDGRWDFFGFWLALGSLSSLCFPVTTGGEGCRFQATQSRSKNKGWVLPKAQVVGKDETELLGRYYR